MFENFSLGKFSKVVLMRNSSECFNHTKFLTTPKSQSIEGKKRLRVCFCFVFWFLVFVFSVKLTKITFFSAEYFRKWHRAYIHKPKFKSHTFHEKYLDLNATRSCKLNFFLAIIFISTFIFLAIVFLVSSIVIGFCSVYLDTFCLFPFFIDIRKIRS